MPSIELRRGDALLLVDIQVDFTSGSLRVPGAGAVIAVLNGYLARFRSLGLPVVATRDWHPAAHCSFRENGGSWPAHCVAGTPGAAFAAGLDLPPDALVVSKADTPERDAYSGFEGTRLAALLRERGIERLFVGGLATDYCVLETVRGARREGFAVMLLEDAIRAVDVHPGDGARALAQMAQLGTVAMRLADLEATVHG
jgi:nicotinamidase-related amidase